MTIIIAPNQNGSARTRGVPMVRSRTSRGGGCRKRKKRPDWGSNPGLPHHMRDALPLSYPAGLWRNHQLQQWVGSGWGSEKIWSTFVLGTLEAGKHDVNNSIGEKLSPGEHSQPKDRRETYPTDSASEGDSSSEYQPDDEPTLLNPKRKSAPSEAGERTPDTQPIGTTAETHLGEESVTQSEPAAEITHPHEESQPRGRSSLEARNSVG